MFPWSPGTEQSNKPVSESARQALSKQLPDSNPSDEKSEGLARTFVSTARLRAWVCVRQPAHFPAQPGDGLSPARVRCSWEGTWVSLLSGARPRETPVQQQKDFSSPPLLDGVPVKRGQRSGLYSREAQPATPGGMGGWSEQEKTPRAASGKHPVRGPVYPSPLSQSAASPSSHCLSLQPCLTTPPSAVAPPGPAEQVSTCRHRENTSCQGAAQPLSEPPNSEMSRDTGARAPFSFLAL